MDKKMSIAKKDFTNMQTNSIYGTIERSTCTKGQQGTASREEQEARAAAMRTQGRKGCKATRINMAITPDNHDFIKTMSRALGFSMAEFTNYVIEAYRTEHPEVMAEFKRVREIVLANRVNGGAEDGEKED